MLRALSTNQNEHVTSTCLPLSLPFHALCATRHQLTTPGNPPPCYCTNSFSKQLCGEHLQTPLLPLSNPPPLCRYLRTALATCFFPGTCALHLNTTTCVYDVTLQHCLCDVGFEYHTPVSRQPPSLHVCVITPPTLKVYQDTLNTTHTCHHSLKTTHTYVCITAPLVRAAETLSHLGVVVFSSFCGD